MKCDHCNKTKDTVQYYERWKMHLCWLCYSEVAVLGYFLK